MDLLAKDISSSTKTIGITAESIEITGTMKWFDIIRGFGFLCPDDNHSYMGDVLLHAACLRNDGYHTISAGARITGIVQKCDLGYHVIKVISMEKPIDENDSARMDDDIEIMPRDDIKPAVVKWFDRIRKFGFLMVDGIEDDVFVHVGILRKYSFSGLYPRQSVLVRLKKGEKGFMAVEIHPDKSKSSI